MTNKKQFKKIIKDLRKLKKNLHIKVTFNRTTNNLLNESKVTECIYRILCVDVYRHRLIDYYDSI